MIRILDRLSCWGSFIVLGELCQSEIKQLNVSIRSEHHVLRLDVAVHYARLVRRRKSARYLNCNVQCFGQGQRCPLQRLPQSLAVHELSSDELPPVYFTQFVNGQNVRMIQGRRRLRLLLKASQAVLVSGVISGQELESYLATKHFVLRKVDFSHSSLAKK